MCPETHSQSLSILPTCKGDIEVLSDHRKRGSQTQLGEILARTTVCAYGSVSDSFSLILFALRASTYLVRTAGTVLCQCPSLLCSLSKAFWDEIFSLLPPPRVSLNKRNGNHNVSVARNVSVVYLDTLGWCFSRSAREQCRP